MEEYEKRRRGWVHVGLRVGGLGECVVGMVDKGKMGVRGTGVRVRGKGVRVQRCVRRVCTCVVHAHLDAHVPQSVTTSRGPARSRRERLPRAALPTLARLVTSVSHSPIRFHIPAFTPSISPPMTTTIVTPTPPNTRRTRMKCSLPRTCQAPCASPVLRGCLRLRDLVVDQLLERC